MLGCMEQCIYYNMKIFADNLGTTLSNIRLCLLVLEEMNEKYRVLQSMFSATKEQLAQVHIGIPFVGLDDCVVLLRGRNKTWS